ncbi:MAG: HEPN domain-containing protein, partial [Gammaproteobacteria bacterium]|nr:HEPN domain-containing protein [Gammaproteobacteria bacterium]
KGQYFLTDIKKEGCLLYDSGNTKLARKRKLKPAEQRRIAQDHYDYWYDSATRFYYYFEIGVKDDDLRRAAFHLHQATEGCYKAILLVFTNYLPHEHRLILLGSMAAKHDAALADIFPEETREERISTVLDSSYIYV